MMTNRLFMGSIALFLPTTNALAEAVRYTPDRCHTRIYFTNSHLSD